MLNMRKDSVTVTQLGLFNDLPVQDTEVIEKALSTFTPPDNCWFDETDLEYLTQANIVFKSDNIERAVNKINHALVYLSMRGGISNKDGIYYLDGVLTVNMLGSVPEGLIDYMEGCDELGIEYTPITLGGYIQYIRIV
jgi:hypothetical protein